MTLKWIGLYATRAGLLPEGSELAFSRGSRVQGNAADIYVKGQERHGIRLSFLPEFNNTMTGREIHAALKGVEAVLQEIDYQKRQA
jgi:hypothetical protein